MSEHHFIGTATRMSTTVPCIITIRYSRRSYESGFPYVCTEFAMGADGEWARGREWDRRRPDEMGALGYKAIGPYNLPSPEKVAHTMGIDYGAALAALRAGEKREAERVAAWKRAAAQVAQ